MSEIAVIIPVYNSEELLPNALTSVLEQSVPVKEIVVVDDGSTDGSYSLLVEWADNHPEINIRILHQSTNQGVSRARNIGWREAEAEWIAFLDADDQWSPNHNEVLSNLVDNDRIGFVFADADRIELQSLIELKSAFSQASLNLNEGQIYPNSDDFKEVYTNLLTGSFIATCSTLVKRKLLVQLGGFDENRRYSEDRLLWLQLFNCTGVAVSPNKVSRVYYHNENATCASHNLEIISASLSLAEDILSASDQFSLSSQQIQIMENEITKLVRELGYASSSRGIHTYLHYSLGLWRRYRLYPTLKHILRSICSTVFADKTG